MLGFDFNMLGFELDMLGSDLNMLGFDLNMLGFDRNMLGFDRNMFKTLPNTKDLFVPPLHKTPSYRKKSFVFVCLFYS